MRCRLTAWFAVKESIRWFEDQTLLPCNGLPECKDTNKAMVCLNRTIKPDAVSRSIQISDVSLSPDGSKIVYLSLSNCKEDQSSTLPWSIWIAETDKPGSERQLSSVTGRPRSPSFHPNGQIILYLADVHQPGGSVQIYTVDVSGAFKPNLLCEESKEQQVTLFSISPNGEHVAFTSAQEESGKRDAAVAKLNENMCRPERLRICSFATGEVRTLGSSKDSSHVNDFVWSSDSCEVLFCAWPGNGAEHRESLMPSDEKTIGVYITGIEESSSPRCIGQYNQSPGPWERQSFLWPTLTEVVEISKYDPSYRAMDGMATHWHSLDSFETPVRGLGETDNPDSMIDLHFDGLVAILVQRGMHTAIEIWKGANYVETLLELHDSALSTTRRSWDIKRVSNGTFKVALIKSSAIHGQPEDIWATTVDTNGNLTLKTPLTGHNKRLQGIDIKTSLLEWDNDGTNLQGTITYPAAYKPSSTPLPTVLLIHSGPYFRATLDFKIDNFRLQLFLASHGYLVLCPNYRGSSGRGSSFARVCGSQLITESWSDCDSMVEYAVSMRLADPARLALAGHSSGGYLAALGASITKCKYRACTSWSGASDLCSLAGTSQTPEFQFSMSGLTPWYAEPENLLRNVGGRMVHPSPVRNLEGVETAFLIVHGEDDPQVPVAQAVVLFRGLRRLSRFPERHAMAIYPGEGHVFTERRHLEDSLSRMLEHLGRFLLQGQ